MLKIFDLYNIFTSCDIWMKSDGIFLLCGKRKLTKSKITMFYTSDSRNSLGKEFHFLEFTFAVFSFGTNAISPEI